MQSDDNLLLQVEMVVAFAGIIVVVFALHRAKWVWALCVSLLTFFGSLYCAAQMNSENSDQSIKVLRTADSLSSVIVTLLCCYHFGYFKSILGVFKMLWIVVLVTSSNVHAIFPTADGLPQSVTLIALVISVFGIVVVTFLTRCKLCSYASEPSRDQMTLRESIESRSMTRFQLRRQERVRQMRNAHGESVVASRDMEAQFLSVEDLSSDSRSKILAEFCIVIGAVVMRFENDVAKIIGIQLGFISWHIACWIASLLCIYPHL